MKNQENEHNSFGNDFDSNLTIVHPEFTEFDIDDSNTEASFFHEVEATFDQSDNIFAIHNDHYSTDSEHGRTLLSAFLRMIPDSTNEAAKVFLLDKGVLLLKEDNPLFEDMLSIIYSNVIVIACKESIKEYSIDAHEKVEILPANRIAADMINAGSVLQLG